MCKSNWPEAFGVATVALGLTMVLTPWERVGEFKWEAVSAIGTLLAVVVAIFIPMIERIAADRVARKERAVLDWANARDVLLCIDQLKDVSLVNLSGLTFPSSGEVDRIITKLESVAGRNFDPIGAEVLARCLEEATTVRKYLHEGEKNFMMRMIHFGQIRARSKERKLLADHADAWMEQILERAKRFDVPLVRR